MSMPVPPDNNPGAVSLPPEMVEAAARALAAEDGELHLFTDPAYVRDDYAGLRWEGAREEFRQRAELALTAALSVCEVERRYAVRGEDDDGSWTAWAPNATVLASDLKSYRSEGMNAGAFEQLEVITPWREVPGV